MCWKAVRMFSDRLLNTELVNTEGKKSVHLADGANFLYITGNEYFDIFPTWDWTKVPGTTAEQETLDIGDGKNIGVKGKTSFVGGVSDGTYGVAAMDLTRGKLAARKAWFFLDDGYVCLGAGITDDSDHPVATSVNQSLKSGDVTEGPTWVHHANIGYVFPDRGNVRLNVASQSGTWNEIGVDGSEAVTKEVFNLWIDHGVRPRDATYSYQVYPCVTSSQTADRAANSRISTISNTPKQQAVYHEGLHMLAAAFWQAGKLDFAGREIEVDRPCLLLINDEHAVISNPENHPATANIRLDGKSIEVKMPDGDAAGSSIAVPWPSRP